MTEIILGIIIGIGIALILIKRKGSTLDESKLSSKKEKILKLFEDKERIKNDDVEDLLDVSDSTATRYLQKLEDIGAIEQKGGGRGTYYVKK